MRPEDLIELGRSEDLKRFKTALVRFAGELDFPLVACTLVLVKNGVQPTVASVGNLPRGFEEYFHDAEDSRRDPVLQKLKRLESAVVYDQSTYVKSGAGDLWEQQARFGYHTGVAVALHIPNCLHLVIGVDRKKPLPHDSARMTRLIGDLQMLVAHAQGAAVRLMKKPSEQVDMPWLEDRIS